METLAKQDYWDASYQRVPFRVADEKDPLRKWIERHARRAGGRALEIGCYPGSYLAVLGELGYQLNGMDLTPRTDKELPDWLRSKGYDVGTFRREDFFDVVAEPIYDVVASFGFIEHFPNWDEVLRRHAAFVRPGGRLIISTPNYRGSAQHLLHRLFDGEGLARHNLDSMDVRAWPRAAGEEFQTRWCGHFGGFAFWVEDQPRNLAQRAALRVIFQALPAMRRAVRFDSEALSPFCGIVADRNSRQ